MKKCIEVLRKNYYICPKPYKMANITINHITQSRISEVDFEHLGFGKVFSDHMFVSDYKDGVWQNHRIVPVEKMSIHPANMALHYGQSIFEGLKASIGKDGTPILFRADKNIERLNLSALRMCMPEFPFEVLMEGMKKLVLIDKAWIPTTPGSSLYLRPFIFATDEYLGVAASTTYRLVVLASPSGVYYSKPVKLLAEDHYVRAVKGGVGEAKTAGNYAASLYPAKLARERGFDQILWLDAIYNKYVQEVGTMNIFFVLKDKVITPAEDGAILKGVTRNSIIQILKSRGIEVEEKLISIDEVMAEYNEGNLVEMFGAGTAAVVTNVSSLTYQDNTITFEEDAWSLSKSLKDTINQLRTGEIEDTFHFTIRVEEALVI